MTQQPIFGVTNIPKNIKLELNNGTLKLKAGSKVYVPNGVGVSDEYQIASDRTLTLSSNNVWFVFYRAAQNSLHVREVSNTYSGPIAPTASQFMYWYDTANNLIQYTDDYGSNWYYGGSASYPLCIITVSGGQITSIDKVFNGFGYIGSSLFVLPGVEGFYPNGKDGLNNLFKTDTNNSLTIYTFASYRLNKPMYFYNSANGIWGGFEIVDKLPNVQDMTLSVRYYNKQDNFVYTNTGSIIRKEKNIPYGYVTTSSSSPYNIVSFEIINPFSTIDYWNISEYSKYIANLLIIQYNNKPKAKMTIESIGRMFPTDLIFAVRDGFNLKKAKGKQIDILAKYIGVDRGYTDSNGKKALLTDEEFNVLLDLKMIVNSGEATLYELENSLYNLFKNGIRVVEGKDISGNPNMTLTYYVREDWANVGLAAAQQNVLPHPTGVGYTYNLAAITKYFGFIEYTDTSHPYTTGFMDYNDPTKEGEMFSYDKQIL